MASWGYETLSLSEEKSGMRLRRVVPVRRSGCHPRVACNSFWRNGSIRLLTPPYKSQNGRSCATDGLLRMLLLL